MSSRNSVYVEVDPTTEKPIRIFRKGSFPHKCPTAVLRQWPKKDATESIRRQVFDRSKGECEFCGARITWLTMHMHEDQFKGNGGEVSLENSKAICPGCHIVRPDSEHGDRRWQSPGPLF